MEELIENISVSLVREFLKRKGLLSTYQALDEELPKNEASITNRRELAKHLHIERLLKKNKEQRHTLNTILEVIAKSLMERVSLAMEDESANMNNARQKNNAELIIEDELETEVMIGRGMDDIIQQQSIQVMPPSQPKPHTKRKHRRSIQQAIQQEVNDNGRETPLSRLEHPSSQNTGDETSTGDSTPSINTNETQRYHNSEETEVLCNGEVGEESVVPNELPADSDEELTAACGDDVPAVAYDQNYPASNEDVPVVKEPVDEEASTSFGDQAVETRQPEVIARPPQKAPDYISSKIKQTDLEKSLDLLRQRRQFQQRAEALLGEETDAVEPSEQPVLRVTSVNPKFQAATEEDSEVIDDIKQENTEEPGTEESYSPRVICTEPVIVSKTNDENKGPEETINKQPVQYKSVKKVISSAKSIDIHTATELKRLVLGSASLIFPENWLSQGLGFCDLPGLLYGLVQNRPGTCGLVSVLQAYFCLELLYIHPFTRDLPSHKKLSPRAQVRSTLLATAISKMLWKCGEEKKAILALPGDTTIFSGGGRFKPDGITETLVVNIMDKYEDVLECTQQFLAYFENDDSNGVVLLLYSAVLSRGIELVVDDMDSADTSLITDDGFCSPELVNLLLCGKAASNVFNDSVELTQGIGKTVVLKGIPARSDIGLVSLLEHTRRRYQVGTFLKTPKYPVWLCFIEQHYCVAFCLNKELVSDWKAERRFDLLYHDPLSRSEAIIRLTIDTTSRFFESPEDDEGVPPLELTLRTKWRDAQIDWNGTEPIAAKSTSNILDDLLSLP